MHDAKDCQENPSAPTPGGILVPSHPAISINTLMEIFRRLLNNGVYYSLGAKASSLTCDSHSIQALDCSGFTRYTAAKASDQKFILPDGSQNQHEFCHGKFEKCSYRDAAIQKNPDKLFICFISPTPEREIGHVWFLHKGITVESHGGKGVDSRAWNTPIEHGTYTLETACSGCYLLPTIP